MNLENLEFIKCLVFYLKYINQYQLVRLPNTKYKTLS